MTHPVAGLDRFGHPSCVLCGLCLAHCPTYREFPLEVASPRGRLALMRGLASGHLEPTRQLSDYLALCLACRACETACPANLPYGLALERARADLRTPRPPSWMARLIERFTLGWAFESRARLGLLVGTMDLYHRLGLSTLVERLFASMLPPRLRTLSRLLPRCEGPRPPAPPLVPPETGTVAFMPGCVADHYLARTNQATLLVLARNGVRTVVPEEAVCCGALHQHRGLLDLAREHARRTIAAFEPSGDVAVVTNSAGCGATLKEYPRLLGGDPAWEERARRFSARVRDLTEFLAGRELRPLGPLPYRVAYDDPCHLLHAQGIGAAPREVLARVPGLTLVPLPESDWCCGSAGLYSLTQIEMSQSILARKVENIVQLGPDVVLTANPGCLLHLRMGLAGHGIRAMHLVDLLAESYWQRPVATGGG
ncbi:MAG: (Fe-S)-binding protein [Candidatus Riflebacteria bacterium]|nr:(Fe-S)-binding protein [Candidatus Riflebacteria bacterium]